MEKVKIRRIGNSLGIILPKDILNILNLNDGDEIELGVQDESLRIVLKRKSPTP